MLPLRKLLFCTFALALLGGTAAIAQKSASQARIIDKVSDEQLVVLKGNTHPAATAKNDLGRVSGNLPMSDLILVLSRSPEQQAAFDAFVASQYDASSPNFHQWLEPAEVGERFGPSLTDIATISKWLTGHGLSVDEVSKDRMTIRFGGTARQVESTFHTEIHNLTVNGEQHIANMTDPQIPMALEPVVVGVKALHNFFPRPLHRLGSKVTLDSASGKWRRVEGNSADARGLIVNSARPTPDFGFTTCGGTACLIEDVSPYDFAAIYNVLPLWTAATPIDGTGQTIAVAGTSRINVADVASFRSTFGLPAGTAPQIIIGNAFDPGKCTASTGICTIDDQIENALDVEWSGAVAKGAKVVLVASGYNSATTPTNDAVYDSSKYVIKNNTAKILNVSYGECELGLGTAQNAAYNTLWQTAESEGIAVFVASGDSGSPACDQGQASSGPYGAQFGLAVSGLASTQHNTAVGGTDLNWGSTASPYWNTTNSTTNGSDAKGYMPEIPWNDTCTNPLYVAFLNSQLKTSLTATQVCDEIATQQIVSSSNEQALLDLVNSVGGGGGVSNCTTSDASTVASCTGGYAKPSWQAGVTGIPADGKRDIPDVSFFASNGFLGSAYLVCVSDWGTCISTTTTAEPSAQEIGGTSAASPAMAGVMALINQKVGAAQGNPNPELYKLAAKQTYSTCKTETGTTSSSCYFNDIDTGTIAMACAAGSPNCTVAKTGDTYGVLTGYAATVGFDPATGLGSLNVANVVNGWTAQIGTGTATVKVTPTPSSINVNQSLSVAVVVSGSSGTPTGTVVLAGGGYTSAAGALTSGSSTFTIPADSLSGGTDTLKASYSGDGIYATASGTATETVTKLTPAVTVTPAVSTLLSSASLKVTGTVTGAAGTATGTVTLAGGGYTSAATTLSSGGYTITIPAGSLSAGTDTLTVTYSGDSSYLTASNSAAVVVTVPLTPTVTVTPAATSVDTGQSLDVTVAVTGAGATPTGTVTLSGGGYTSAATALSAGGATITIPANKLSAGTDTLTVTYSGDTVYASGTGTTSVTVTASVYSLAAGTAAAVTAGGSTTSTVTATSTTDYSGTVTLTCALTASPAGATKLPSCSPASGSSTITFAAGTASGTGTMNVTTTAAVATLVKPRIGGWAGAGGGVVLAFLVFLGIPARRRSWRAMLGVVALMVALGSLAACGGGSSGSKGTPGTTAGTYTFTVTGTGSPAVTPAPTTTFTVTVN